MCATDAIPVGASKARASLGKALSALVAQRNTAQCKSFPLPKAQAPPPPLLAGVGGPAVPYIAFGSGAWARGRQPLRTLHLPPNIGLVAGDERPICGPQQPGSIRDIDLTTLQLNCQRPFLPKHNRAARIFGPLSEMSSYRCRSRRLRN
jgi:hypothetical protein